jgi:hypothetical protein
MRDGYAEPDPGAAPGLALLNRAKHFRVVAAEALGQMPRELGYDTGLIPCGNRHDDLIRLEDFGQEHGCTWDSMDQS